MTAGTSGTWLARWRDPETGRQHQKPLGGFDERPPNERYDAAVRAAQAWFTHIGLGGSTETISVRQACEQYVEWLLREKGEKAASDARRRFRQHVYDQPAVRPRLEPMTGRTLARGAQKIARVTLDKLTPRQVEAWRRMLEDLPTIRGGIRTPSSVNRDMVSLKAALNHAFKTGLVGTDYAWRTTLAPIKGADRRRDVYLDRSQRQALIEAAAPDLALLIRALCILPFRPGAMAALTVADYDQRLHTIKIRTDKAHAGRIVKLPNTAGALFAQAAKSKTPSARLFTRWDGAAWQKDKWKHPVRAAMRKAGLPANATLYSLRHTTITDLVSAGTDLATVATLAGTSVLMIQKNYYHLQQDAAAKALETLAL